MSAVRQVDRFVNWMCLPVALLDDVHCYICTLLHAMMEQSEHSEVSNTQIALHRSNRIYRMKAA